MEPFLEGTGVHYKKNTTPNGFILTSAWILRIPWFVKCQTLKKNMQFLYLFWTETVIEKHTKTHHRRSRTISVQHAPVPL